MVTIKIPLLLTFLLVLIIVLIINFISQTYLIRKNNYQIKWKSYLVVLVQSIVITMLLYWF